MYLVEHEGDSALLEGEGQVGRVSLTTSYGGGHIGLNNEGPIGLKDEHRETR